ncbi:MAG: hypothetical protein U0169_10315 [Polyangiaceae bacterium]
MGTSNSVVTSFRALMDLEEERVAEEARVARERAARDAEDARRRLEEAERRGIEAARRDEAHRAELARREREEAARIEALKLAAVERAARDSEWAARAREAEVRHVRDLELARMRTQGASSRARVALATTIVSPLVAIGIGAIVWATSVRPSLDDARTRLMLADSDRVARETEHGRVLRAKDERIAELGRDLDAARATIDDLRRPHATAVTPRAPSSPHATPRPAKVDDPCAHPGDPLCGSLAH